MMDSAKRTFSVSDTSQLIRKMSVSLRKAFSLSKRKSDPPAYSAATANKNSNSSANDPSYLRLSFPMTQNKIVFLHHIIFTDLEVTASTTIQAFYRSFKTRQNINNQVVQKHLILSEIIETEKSYFKSLNNLISQINMLQIQESKNEDHLLIKTVLDNLHEMSKFSLTILPSLERKSANWTKSYFSTIGDVFHIPSWDNLIGYIGYSILYADFYALHRIWIEKRNVPFQLSNWIIAPIQRLVHYISMLQVLRKIISGRV